MDQRLQLQQKMSQRLIMTPQMQQSIQLLQLSTLELNELLQEEMVENPLLEDGDPTDGSDESAPEFESELPDDRRMDGNSDGASAGERDDFSDTEATPEYDSSALTDSGHIELDENWADYFSDSSDLGSVTYGASSYSESDDEESNVQLAHEESLKDHLIWQLGVSIGGEEDYVIGEYILDQLDEDGYLKVSVEDIALTFDKPLEEIERILKVIQRFDPPGIGARSLEECLEIQCRHLEIDDDDIIQVIRHHLDELERRRYKEIARSLGVTEKHVQEIADIISNLDPRPGARYQILSNEYISPDVFVEKIGNEWQVRVSDDSAPPLRISRRYREMLQNPDSMSAEDFDFIKKKFQSAIWLIRNIEQRKRTLYRVTRAIMDKQEGFLEEGLTALKPLKLRDIADELGIHEATVCRVVNKKYVQTPRGLFELKYFFSTGLDATGGDDMSAKSVMEIIRNLIDEEDPKRPLSDQKITEILHRDYNLNIARRTVAKYREKMGILPTSKRKRV
ncbi:MAG: RNA polymerase factor sigma-54 [bacterium]|nr:RNA polymerase factor sigma-54 [bacterium]